ncbi:MAG: hypothetical protein KY458_10270 [Actinobacteria bacterium]|nr:hypothetical protein [Actinomycetota bacterium]
MGYTLELWALPLAALEAELTTPTIDQGRVEDDDTLPADVVERWPELASQVAGVIASGGGEIAGLLAVYVHAVVRIMGTHYGSLDHTSSGGEEFRRRFLPGPAAARFGKDTIAKLVNRPIATLSWGDYPVLGWLSAAEAAQAVEAAASHQQDPGDADVRPLEVLGRAIARVAAVRVDLVSAYG